MKSNSWYILETMLLQNFLHFYYIYHCNSFTLRCSDLPLLLPEKQQQLFEKKKKKEQWNLC